ncbi:MAG: hypothetical protein ACREEC_13640, partial [Thermoplasmata archaeon]
DAPGTMEGSAVAALRRTGVGWVWTAAVPYYEHMLRESTACLRYDAQLFPDREWSFWWICGTSSAEVARITGVMAEGPDVTVTPVNRRFLIGGARRGVSRLEVAGSDGSLVEAVDLGGLYALVQLPPDPDAPRRGRISAHTSTEITRAES